ncbi:site-specific DNA-methyltransferase [Microcoleus sp. CAWBG58]|uniref:site-specific DNA-methyltransferase n=1 Tax=Microcoleus sp. CAWBG58 TaxID=2841651 RepID=UPI0025D0E533|nr:site-specific DNA-methyltransferase [Microcoleus sp. CAWBG58]
MNKKQRLELTWIGKDIRPKLEPRILLEDPEMSYHAAHQVSENDIFDNRLIFGDNLLALKALESEFAGKVKCIFIDPPYNTGSAFEHYDDGIEHSLWLGLMRDRLEILRNLLSNDGSLWIAIDDNEAHYLKVMCDEIFGRINFVANVVWQKKYAASNDALWFSNDHDHILVYAKVKTSWKPNRLPRTEKSNSAYKNPDNDPRGAWQSDNYTCNKSIDERPNLYYPIANPNTGEIILPKKTAVWRYSRDRHEDNERQGLVYWGVEGKNSVPRFKRLLSAVSDKGGVAQTIWRWEEVGHNQDAKREQLQLNEQAPFSTPKPEKLLERILQLATNPKDIVLDSFAGSGTTGAVAQKMGRQWIMIELGEHCHTHIIPRLKKVIDGEDRGGITKAVNWKGGGGFRYYRLAPSLLEKDKWDNWVIDKDYNAAMLAEALCKIEGFTYAPSDTFYWQHGYSTESDFIYVTTQNFSHEQLSKLADEVGQERTLLVLCTAFRGETDIFPNLTVKKIPKQILSRCEWGHDDYSLKIENLPKAPPKCGQLSLFDMDTYEK